MIDLPLNQKSLTERLVEIENGVFELRKFQDMPLAEFLKGQNFAIAEHYLRRGLEAVFDISNHILSRSSGALVKHPDSYKAVAAILGEIEVVPKDFADGALSQMAGYRNRLVHFYHKVTKEELHEIIQNNLFDLEKFCSYIKKLMENPKEFGFEIE